MKIAILSSLVAGFLLLVTFPVMPATGDSASHGFPGNSRVYSVAQLAESDIPVGTVVLVKGRIASFGYAGTHSKPFAVIEDEQQTGKALLCAMTENEGAEASSFYRVGEAVRVSGQYFGTSSIGGKPPMPSLYGCQMAGPQKDAVEPAAK